MIKDSKADFSVSNTHNKRSRRTLSHMSMEHKSLKKSVDSSTDYLPIIKEPKKPSKVDRFSQNRAKLLLKSTDEQIKDYMA